MRTRMMLMLLLGGAALAASATAAEHQFGAGCRMCGRKTCCVTAEMKKAMEPCWEVDCKEICIPRVRFPWSKCCEPQCGRVRAVKFLKVEEYEVERCEYEWQILDLCESCRSQCGPAVPSSDGSLIAPPPAPAFPPPAPPVEPVP